MAISAKDVMTLRQRTGVGMMECKSALVEANGDMDTAIGILRKKLKGDMDDRSDREASEGVVAIARSSGAVAMIELCSETDFAARNESFIEASQKIADLALTGPEGEPSATEQMTKIVDDLRITLKENISLERVVKFAGGAMGSYLHHNRKAAAIIQCEGEMDPELLIGLCQHLTAAVPPLIPAPLAADESGLPADAVEKQKAIFVEEARSSGKPESIIEKMIVGKMRKWIDEHTLLGQTYIRELDAKKPVRHYLPPGTTVTRFARSHLGA